MTRQIIRFGVIGCGLMGKEFASAAARWCHLSDVDFEPQIVAFCDPNPGAARWFQDYVPTVTQVYSDHRQMLKNASIDAIYCAVPHNLHEVFLVDVETHGGANKDKEFPSKVFVFVINGNMKNPSSYSR